MGTLALATALSMMSAPVVDPEQMNCLAMNIYHESRGERVEGRVAVAHVTMNRAAHKSWPDDICAVVYDNKQFSWTFTIKDHTPKETKAWLESQVIARDVMIGNTTDPTNGAVFYHANWVNPSWSKYNNLTISKVIGAHIFYTWDGKWNEKK